MPIIDLETNADAFYPWRVRAALAERPVKDPAEQRAMVSVAIRHIARHRGWRNPYSSVDSLLLVDEPTSVFRTFIGDVGAKLNRSLDPSLTVAQIAVCANLTKLTGKLRGSGGLLENQVRQADNARELRRIWQVQQLPQDSFKPIIRAVFAAKSPKGSAAALVGKDPLAPKEYRAQKASLTFQRYRIMAIVANLRLQQQEGQDRPLHAAERRAIADFLWNTTSKTVNWTDVAQRLGVSRRQLTGTALATADGDRPSQRPPINVTAERIRDSKISELVAWWDRESESAQEAMLAVLSNGFTGSDEIDQEEVGRASEYVASLPAETLAKIDLLKLPEGRAAYSLATLRRLTRRMEATEEDLHASRKAEFGVPDDWRPPADPIGEPVGNPAVDRVLKIVARWLAAVEEKWGCPISVNIEHTRDGLISESAARKIDRDNNRRAQENSRFRQEVALILAKDRGSFTSIDDSPAETHDGPTYGTNASDVAKRRAFVRQEGRCLYCGVSLEHSAMEFDHIVPRAGVGSTNTQVNLAAICHPCNQSKGKQPFAVWVASGARPGVTMQGAVERTQQMFGMGSKSREDREFIGRVVDRLARTDEDEPIDARSLESVGWMANELRRRIEHHYQESGSLTSVSVFRGWVTAAARRASGIEKRFFLIGGTPGKNRLDRRHHAMDAATIAMLEPRAANVLAVRDNLRRSQQLTGLGPGDTPWKSYPRDQTGHYAQWVGRMVAMSDLLVQAIGEDRIPVFEFLRLRLGSSKGHEDTIRPFRKGPENGPRPQAIRVGDELPMELIDRSATPAQWVALTRVPGFVSGVGLPADEERTIRIHDRHLQADSELDFFPTGSGCVAVRGGYAELGGSFHHARIYRCTAALKSGKESVFFAMMRVYQIDLLRFRKENLFAVEIPPQAISRRTSEGRLREAMDAGRAEYVGWIVLGDELRLDMDGQNTGAIGQLLEAYPGITRWSVDGLVAPAKLRLRPRLLSAEGLPESTAKGPTTIIKGAGWRPSVNVAFGACRATVIRRNILGQPRLVSRAGLPVCWPLSPFSSQESNHR
jgi:CRISPR-associated endonuclease Csn1